MAFLRKIGIFDSGIGGLTVLKECEKQVCGARYYYLGDNSNAPYGSKTKEEIERLVFSAMKTFERIGVDAAVLACNTATAVCAEKLRREFSFPIVGMEPALSLAARRFSNVLVLCTPQTAKSERLKRLIEKNPHCKFTVCPCADLAIEIERAVKGETPFDLEKSLPAPSSLDPETDGVVLGCTHYIFCKKEIEQFYGKPAVDGNAGTAKQLQNVINKFSDSETSGILNHNYPRQNPAVSFLGDSKKINKRVYKTLRNKGNFGDSFRTNG